MKRKEEALDPEKNDTADKVWQYKIHEENIFYQRLNFFLVAESMLLVAFATLFDSSKPVFLLILVLSSLGCVLTFVWIYVSDRQLEVMKQITKEAEPVIPIYSKIRQQRPKALLSSTKLLAYGVPAIVFITWVVLITVTTLQWRAAPTNPPVNPPGEAQKTANER